MIKENTKPDKKPIGVQRRRGLLGVAILSQLATLIITFPTWRVRTDPPNLPLLDVPQIEWLWLILIFSSTVLPWWLGRNGSWIHLLVLVLSCLWDQYRIQPQFYFGWVFIFAASSCVGQRYDESDPRFGWRFCRWALIALWLWAGIHKLISPEWMTFRSQYFMHSMGMGEVAERLHGWFALAIGVSEVGLALIACWKPRAAAWLCIPLHIGIVISLLIASWNFSVIPWNVSAAVFGFLILNEVPEWKFDRREWLAGVLLMIVPALFYVGKVDRAFAFVLYSGMTPTGLISHMDEPFSTDKLDPRVEKIYGWNELAVPFPQERRTLRQHFELTAREGSKLYIRDPRAFLDDQYFVKTKNGSKRITKNEFYSMRLGSVMGIAHDSRASLYAFQGKDVQRLKRSQEGMIYAIKFTPENYSRELLAEVAGYPNVEQIELANCDVSDDDLKLLTGLFRLEGIGLSNTKVTAAGLRHLESLPMLHLVEIEGSQISPDELDEFWERLD